MLFKHVQSKTECFQLTMLSRATSDDDQPMPGYLFKEINCILLA